MQGNRGESADAPGQACQHPQGRRVGREQVPEPGTTAAGTEPPDQGCGLGQRSSAEDMTSLAPSTFGPLPCLAGQARGEGGG